MFKLKCIVFSEIDEEIFIDFCLSPKRIINPYLLLSLVAAMRHRSVPFIIIAHKTLRF